MKVAIIGMGVMGHAIEGLLAQNQEYEVMGIGKYDRLEAFSEADIAMLAIKPSKFAEVANNMWIHVQEQQLIISIMAGITLRELRNSLGTDNVVRAMPNLALAQGESLTAWQAAHSEVNTTSAEAIFATWGTSIQLQNEALFGPFTAMAGSGPAYFFEMARQLERIALTYGFSTQQAKQIAAQTLIGAGSVIAPESDMGEQVERVASKGGTTEAGLGVFVEEGRFARLMQEAVAAATHRSIEIGKSLK